MKYFIGALSFISLLASSAAMAQGPQIGKTTARSLLADCQSTKVAIQHKALGATNNFQETDKVGTAAIFWSGTCVGYIAGWMEGRDLTFAIIDGRAFRITVLAASVNDVVNALEKRVSEKPLDNDKLADEVLFRVFLDNRLVRIDQVQIPFSASSAAGPPKKAHAVTNSWNLWQIFILCWNLSEERL